MRVLAESPRTSLRAGMRPGMMAVMTNVKFATSLPEDAVRAARELAAQAGIPIGEWIGRVIRAEAIRAGVRALHDALENDTELRREWQGRVAANEADAAALLYEDTSGRDT